MQDMKRIIASAVISELQSSDMYLTLKARLFDLRANLNGVRVTEGFLDEIIENEEKYICIPLYADIRGLLANRTIGHMYNSRTGEFHSTQIGSFYHYEKETIGEDTYLVGYARIMKRNKALCKALGELFADNALKFSFEICCGAYENAENGDMVIDANPANYFEGECVVTFPACENATAIALVAECLGKGDENMPDEKNVTAETEETKTEIETKTAEVTAEEEAVSSETETAETIMITHNRLEVEETSAYNCENGEEVSERVVVETTVRTPVEIAEDEEQNEDEPVDEDDSEEKEHKEVAEASENTEYVAEASECAQNQAMFIAEIKEALEAIRKELAEIKAANENKKEEMTSVIAQVITSDNSETALLNPFMAEISAPKGKYSLLEEEKTSVHSYTLLDRA